MGCLTCAACLMHAAHTKVRQVLTSCASVGRTEKWSLTLQQPGVDPLAIGLAGIACHRAFHQSAQCHMVVRWKACETVVVGHRA